MRVCCRAPSISKEFLDFALFGALGGSILGHEIAHAFDPNGIDYDASWSPNSWLSESSQLEFLDNQNYFAPKSNFCIEKFCVDTKKAIGEMMADAIGMQIAYESLLLQSTKHERIEFPGFENFSVEKWFFLAYANAECSSETIWQQKFAPEPTSTAESISSAGAEAKFWRFCCRFQLFERFANGAERSKMQKLVKKNETKFCANEMDWHWMEGNLVLKQIWISTSDWLWIWIWKKLSQHLSQFD